MSEHDEERAAATKAQGIAAAAQTLQSPAQLQLIDLEAQLARRRYVAAIKHGFTPGEALWLCTQRIVC